jgi:hypothetical protein
MPNHPIPIEERIRHYTELGYSTREIAPRVRRSQSTVVRVQHRINTGPHPILRPGTEPPARIRRRSLRIRPDIRLMLGLLAVAVAGLTGFLMGTSPGSVRNPQVTACIRMSTAGVVTGITAPGGGGTCPPRWETVMLPGR